MGAGCGRAWWRWRRLSPGPCRPSPAVALGTDAGGARCQPHRHRWSQSRVSIDQFPVPWYGPLVPGAQNNQLSRAKDNKPFQCRDGRNSQLRRRLAARVKKGIFRNFAKFKLTARDSRTRIVFWLSYVTASGVKLYLCGHGKGRRDRYPQNILCECPMLRLRWPGPWPGAEAVTAELSCHGRVTSYHISWSWSNYPAKMGETISYSGWPMTAAMPAAAAAAATASG